MRFFTAIIILISLIAITAEAQDYDSIMFSYDSAPVNQAMIKAYKSDPSIWTKGNLFIVGMCCIHEKKYKEAKEIFSRLSHDEPQNTHYARSLANAAYLNDDIDEAQKLSSSLWKNERDVYALKILGVIAVQQDDISIIRSLVEDLQIHKSEDFDIRKVLLTYSLQEEDLEKAKIVYTDTCKGLKKSEIAENPDFRKILIKAMLRFGDL